MKEYICPISRQAWIRGGKSGKPCPFGLPVPLACVHAGNSTANMCPIEIVDEDKNEHIVKMNKRVYIWYRDGTRCIYAQSIVDSKGVVNCDFGDSGQGMGGGAAFEGSPLYAQTFAGVGLDGLYAFPLGFYTDSGESRNLFQGLFSLLGHDEREFIIKKNYLRTG